MTMSSLLCNDNLKLGCCIAHDKDVSFATAWCKDRGVATTKRDDQD